jgi:hypothetical protein
MSKGNSVKTDAAGAFFDGGVRPTGPREPVQVFGSGNKSRESVALLVRRSEERPFRAIMEKVASGNVAAERITTATINKRDNGDAAANSKNAEAAPQNSAPAAATPENSCSVVATPGMALEQRESDDQVVFIDATVAQAAATMVQQVLAELSGALGITIFGEGADLVLTEVNEDTAEHFAEIVFILRKMVEGFDTGSAAGMVIETPKGALSGSNIDECADLLRTSAFKIEMACNVLGIGTMVQERIALKMEHASSNILQAVDPSTIAMAAHHTERLFGNLFSDTAESPELKELIEKVRQLIAQEPGTAPHLSTTAQETSKPATSDALLYTAQVYRALLGIDGSDEQAAANSAAADGSGKFTQLDNGDVVLAVPPPLADADNEAGELQPPAATAAHNVGRLEGTAADARIPQALTRMADETVMEQITAKVHGIVRSGLTEVRIQLRPESLGEVTMRIRIEGDLVMGKIEVMNRQVKEIVERNLPMLKDALAEHNLDTGKIDVEVGREGRESFAGRGHGEAMTSGNSGSGVAATEEESASGAEIATGRETGRRFGDNSIEYFA